MPNYNFKKDLPIARKTEEEVAEILKRDYGAKIEDFCISNQYDIKATIEERTFTVEVKEDFSCEITGNVGLEFECRGRPSGIQTSQADFYIYKIHTAQEGIRFYVYKTSVLKRMVAEEKYFRIVSGGDKGSNSMNYLFKYGVFTEKGKLIASNP